jgi:hypothetical protein
MDVDQAKALVEKMRCSKGLALGQTHPELINNLTNALQM